MPAGHVPGGRVDAATLAALVVAAPRLPMVTAHGVVPDELGGVASGATTRRARAG